MAVIAVSLVILAIRAGEMETMSVQEVSFLGHAMPQLVGVISAQIGDGRLAYLNSAAPPATNASGLLPNPELSALERARHVALVDDMLATLGIASPASMDAEDKLLMYTMAVNMMRMEKIIYGVSRLMDRTDVILELVQSDMVEEAQTTLYQIHNLTSTIVNYLDDIRNGKASLPVNLSSG